MEVRMTEQMLTALKHTAEIPDNLRARADAARQDGDAFVVTLDDDERIAMTEMCEWYVRTDPDTGELTEQGAVFDSMVQAIIDADMVG